MKRRREFRVLFVAQDVGGFNAVFPVFRKVRQTKGWMVQGIFGELNAHASRGTRATILKNDERANSRIRNLFDRTRPDLLVTGTSAGLSLDKLAVAEAKARKIPTIAVLDFWGNHFIRFSHPGTKDLAFLSDVLCVTDVPSKRDMVKLGFDGKRIFVTGNPHFDAFARRKPLRRGDAIIYFSQPFSEMVRQFPDMDPGYREQEVFEEIVAGLERLPNPPKLVVRFHPREVERTKYDETISRSRLSIRIDERSTNDAILRRASLAVGMNTMVLFEAVLSGIPAVSYQPHLKGEDRFVPNGLHLTRAVYRREDLVRALKQSLVRRTKAVPRAMQPYLHGQATNRVIEQMQHILKTYEHSKT